MRSLVVAVLLLSAASNCAVAQHSPLAADAKPAHPAPGTSIVRFAQVDDGVYKGSKPKTAADYKFLRSKGIKYILDLKFFPMLYRREKHKAEKYGMLVLPATINASPIPPSEKHVRQILCILGDKHLRPIYFHCDIGRDRTSLIATLYELQFRGLPPEIAWQEMQQFGFKDGWTLHGLTAYVRKHASSPMGPGETACNPMSLPTIKTDNR